MREQIFAPYSDFDVNKVKSGEFPYPPGNFRHYNYCLTKEFLEKTNLDISNYFVFTFVRNPWERVVSWANMNVRIHKVLPALYKQYLIAAVNQATNLTYKQSTYYNIPTDQNQPQKKIDYIGSLETHDADIKRIGNILGLDLNINISTFRDNPLHEEISKFWDAELIQRIREKESETIDLMGYKENCTHYLTTDYYHTRALS